MTFWNIMSPLSDAVTDGSGGGTAGSTDAGASGQQPTGTQQQPSSQQSAQPGTPAGTQQQSGASNDGQTRTGAQSGNGQQFDPKDFIPRHRFNEVSGRVREQDATIQDLQRRLTLALGGQPTDPQTQKSEQVRAAFFEMFPQFKRLAELSEEQFEALLQAPTAVQTTRQAEAQQWQRHGDQQIDSASERVAEIIGVDALDDDQREDLRVSLRSWLDTKARAELAQAVERYGEQAVREDERRFSPTIARYEKGDPKLLDEFVNRYTKNWVEPARRAATARTSTRTRPVPGSGSRTPVSTIQKPATFKNWDERLDYAAKLAKERGASFNG